MREFKDLRIAVAGTGYVGLSIATLLSQHHKVTAVDIIPEKVELINNKMSPIQDEYIEKYLAEKELNLTATLDAKEAYSDADFVVIAAPTNYDSKKNFFDTSAVEAVIKLVIEYPDMSGCLYNMKVLDKLGYYDQNTYFYGLDEEYCIRVRKNGYKIIQCSEAVLNHHPAETYCVRFLGKTVLKCGKDNPQRYYYQFRSGYYIHKKYHNLHNFMFCVYKFTKVVLFFDHKKEYFKMVRIGIMDAKNGFYGNIKERNES